MATPTTQIWTSSDGDIAVAVTPAEGPGLYPVEVRVYCADAPQEVHAVVIGRERARTHLRFGVGERLQVEGELWCEPVAGAAMLMGDFDYRLDGAHNIFKGPMLDLEGPAGPGPGGEEECGCAAAVSGAAGPAAGSAVGPAAPRDEPGGAADLFPYLYLLPQPPPAPAHAAAAFVQRRVDPEDPQGLIGQLAALPAASAERAVLAGRFVAGEPPFAGVYVAPGQPLPPPLEQWPVLAAALAAGGDPQALLEKAAAAAGGDRAALAQVLAAAGTRAFTDRFWQSWIALALLPGHDDAHRDGLAGLLRLDHLFRIGAADPAPGAALLACAAGARIELPAGLFPAAADETLRVLGAGEVQMVRRRLLRYRLGAVARIESLMPGERRETSHRRSRREVDLAEHSDRREEGAVRLSGSRGDELAEAVRRTLLERQETDRYDNLQVSYGAPVMATVGGTRSRTVVGGMPPARDRTRLAREVLDASVGRLTRELSALRSGGRTEEQEERARTVLDNSQGDRQQVAIYRWLEEVHEASVAARGGRLVLELLLARPAAALLRAAQLAGLPPEPPRSPAEQGLGSWRDLTGERYVELAAAYGLAVAAPAPEPCRRVSVTLRPGERREVELPPGYQAESATATAAGSGAPAGVLLAGAALPCDGRPQPLPDGVMERVALAVPTVPAAAPAAQPVAEPPPAAGTQAEAGAAAVTPAEPPATPAAPGVPEPPCPPPVPVGAVVGVSIGCRPSPALLDGWRLAAWSALEEAYRGRVREYLGAAAGPAPAVPAAFLGHERRALRRAALARLLACADAPTPAGRYDAVTLLERAVVWEELTCCTGAPQAEATAACGVGLPDSGLTRLLLPVRAEQAAALLYFLASGTVWRGTDPPVQPGDVSALLALEGAMPAAERCSWELVVPTALQLPDEHGGALVGRG